MRKHLLSLFVLALFLCVFAACSTQGSSVNDTATGNLSAAAPTKVYQLSNIQHVSSNDTNCNPIYNQLTALGSSDLSFKFAQDASGANTFDLSDPSGLLQHHQFEIVLQQVDAKVLTRTGVGSFTLNGISFTYTVDVTGDASESGYQFSYPVTLSGDNGHCNFTATLTPDAATQQAFIHDIESGTATNGNDLRPH